MQARAVLEDGELDLGPAKVPVRAVRFQGEALAGAVLGEIWHGYHNVRGPVARWLRSLCDDSRPEVWVRASIAAGVLCSWDWIHGFRELVVPLAVTDEPVARMAAATALAESARDARVRPAVADVLKNWASSDDEMLVRTALLAHGYVLAAGSVSGSLDALARVVRVREATDTEVLVPASFSVARLLACGEPAPVLRRLRQWLEDGRLQPRQPGPPRRHPHAEHPDHPSVGAAGGPRARQARGPAPADRPARDPARARGRTGLAAAEHPHHGPLRRGGPGGARRDAPAGREGPGVAGSRLRLPAAARGGPP